MIIAASRLLIEQCEDGSLVYNESTGATTLLNENAGSILRLLCSLGEVAETELRSTTKRILGDIVDFPVILASLEESRLVFRC